MIENRIGDLLRQKDLSAICHVCNCFHTFGSGIAKQIREQFPEAYEADLHTKSRDRDKMGTFSFATIKNGVGCYNMYAQYRYGRERRHLEYPYFKHCLVAVRDDLKSRFGTYKLLGIPYKVGCVNAGGDWGTVLDIIKEIFEKDTVRLVICEYKQYSAENELFRLKLRNAYKKAELLGEFDGPTYDEDDNARGMDDL